MQDFRRAESIYIGFAIVGTIGPIIPMVEFLMGQDTSWITFFSMFPDNPFTRSLGVDLSITTLLLWVWMALEWNTYKRSWLWFVLLVSLNICIAVSSALPLWLYLRCRWSR